MTVVAARHLRVRRHGRGIWQPVCVVVGLGEIRRRGDPELLDIVIVAGQVVGHSHAVLGIHVGVGHSHALSCRCHVCQAKGTPQRRRASVSFVLVGRKRTAFVPAWRGQRCLTVHTGWGGCRRVKGRETRGHRRALAGTQGRTIDIDSETIGHVSLGSHVVGFFGFQVFLRSWIDFPSCAKFSLW